MVLTARKAFPFLFAVVTGVAVFSYVYLAAGSVEAKVYSGRQCVELPVANTNIKRFTVIKLSMLRHRRFLAADVNRLAAKNGAAVAGKVALEAIYQGEQIIRPRLSVDTRARVSTQVSPGKVAIEIKSEADTITSTVAAAGDHIDIIATSRAADGVPGQQLFKNVLVLGRAGDTLLHVGGDGVATDPAGSLMAEVSPDQARAIVRATGNGEIRVLLHSSRVSSGGFHE